MSTESEKVNGFGRVAVGTRMNDRCDPYFFNSWTHLIAGGLRPGDTVLDAAIELPQHWAATLMAKKFLKSDADTLCTIDTDMVFKKDALERLRSDERGLDFDIISALSCTRRKPFLPIVLRLLPEGQPGPSAYECKAEEIDGAIVPVDSVGTGFTLIRRSVFDRMKDKFQNGGWWFQFGESGLGEDTRFCQEAKEIGAKIGVHTGISIGHRGPLTFVWDYEKKMTMLESYDQVAELIQEEK